MGKTLKELAVNATDVELIELNVSTTSAAAAINCPNGINQASMSRNNNNSTAKEQKKDYRLTKEMEEDETIDHFFNLVQHKLHTSHHHLEDLLLGDHDDAEYQAEENLLVEVNNNGLLEGAIAGVTTFACLVAGPPLIRRFIPPKTYKLDIIPSSTTKKSNIPKYLLMGMRLGVQTAASLVVAAYTTSYFTDEEFMLEHVARAPLLEGRSVIADEFCPTVCREYYRHHSQEYWRNVKSPYLKNLSKFVENCARRKSMEQSIRQERGQSIDMPVSIPSPGVPKSYPIDEKIKEELANSSDVDDDDQDDDWVKVLVMDQEGYGGNEE